MTLNEPNRDIKGTLLLDVEQFRNAYKIETYSYNVVLIDLYYLHTPYSPV